MGYLFSEYNIINIWISPQLCKMRGGKTGVNPDTIALKSYWLLTLDTSSPEVEAIEWPINLKPQQNLISCSDDTLV